MKYVAGKKNNAADTLSRYPSLKALPIDTEIAEAEEVNAVTSAAMIASFNRTESDVIIDHTDVERVASGDEDYQLLLKRVRDDNWPRSKNLVESALKPYFQVRDRLSYINGLVTYAFDEGHIQLG